MMKKLFCRSKSKPKNDTLEILEKLQETLDDLEKKEKLFAKKVSLEVEKAKTFSKENNKRAALQCLKRKRMYEDQIEKLCNNQMRIHDQMILLEGAKITTATLEAMEEGAAAMKRMQKGTNIDDVDKTMEELLEQADMMKQMQDALAVPIGPVADIDDEDLIEELAKMEAQDLEKQLLQPTTKAPEAPINVPEKIQPARLVSDKKRYTEPDEEDIEVLRAEMAAL